MGRRISRGPNTLKHMKWLALLLLLWRGVCICTFAYLYDYSLFSFQDPFSNASRDLQGCVALDPLFALSLIQVLNPNRKWKSVSIRCAIARFAKNSSPASTHYITVLKAQARSKPAGTEKWPIIFVLFYYSLKKTSDWTMTDGAVDKNDPINQLLDKAKPIISKISFGSIVGYCSGAAAKKIGKAVAILCGLGFIAIQSGKNSTWNGRTAC